MYKKDIVKNYNFSKTYMTHVIKNEAIDAEKIKEKSSISNWKIIYKYGWLFYKFII